MPSDFSFDVVSKVDMHAVEDGLEGRRRVRLAGELGNVRFPQCAFVVSGQHRSFRSARSRFLLEAGRVDLVEPFERLRERRAGVFEAALACCEAAEIHARHQGKRTVARGVDRSAHFLEQLASLVEAALIGEDLGDVVVRHRDAGDVADAFE